MSNILYSGTKVELAKQKRKMTVMIFTILGIISIILGLVCFALANLTAQL